MNTLPPSKTIKDLLIEAFFEIQFTPLIKSGRIG
jgi:hypothetical protein